MKFIYLKMMFEFFLALSLLAPLFSLCTVDLYANEDVYTYIGNEDRKKSDIYTDIGIEHRETSDIYTYIEAGIMAMDEKIDISEYNIKSDGISDVLIYTLKSSPWLFFVDSSFTYSINSFGNIENIYPKYTMSLSQRDEAFDFCLERIEKILFYMPLGMSEFDMALYLHDYICQNFEYDESYESRDVYGMLKYGRGTCQGYTSLFLLLARRVGLLSDIVYSDSMCHIWNCVKIDGEWYYIDLTWDDGDLFSVSHKNFLFSENEAKSLGYYEYVKREGIDCISDKYSGEYLDNIFTPMAYVDGKWYFAENSATVRGVSIYDVENDTADKIISIEGYWRDEDNKIFASCFSSAVSVGGRIYFNTKNKIYGYIGGECVEIYSAPENKQIYYISTDGKNIYFSFFQSGDEIQNIIIPSDGDIDGDGNTNLLDVIKLSLALEEKSLLLVDKFSADMSGDAKIENDDLNMLRNFLVEDVD